MNARYGFIRWTKSKIEAIIKNQTYTGQIAWDRRGGRRNPHKSTSLVLSPLEPNNQIVSSEVWETINKERGRRYRSKDSYYYKTGYLLKDKLICANCKSLMKPINPGKGKNTVYKCTSTAGFKCDIRIPSISVDEEFFKFMHSEKIKINDSEAFWQLYNETFDRKSEKYFVIQEGIKDKINYFEEVIEGLENILTKESIEDLRKAINTQLVIYKSQIQILKEESKKHELRKNLFRKTKEEMASLLNYSIPSLFLNEDFPEVIKLRREFVVNFVEKVEVSYVKFKNEILFKEIVFGPPEFI